MAKKLRELLILRGHNSYYIASISHHKGDALGLPPPDMARRAGIPRSPRTHPRTNALCKDLGGRHVIPPSWRGR